MVLESVPIYVYVSKRHKTHVEPAVPDTMVTDGPLAKSSLLATIHKVLKTAIAPNSPVHTMAMDGLPWPWLLRVSWGVFDTSEQRSRYL